MSTDDGKYPQRPQYFASGFHQLMKTDDLVVRYGSLGQNIYLLLSFVVTTEDQKYYSGPVGF